MDGGMNASFSLQITNQGNCSYVHKLCIRIIVDGLTLTSGTLPPRVEMASLYKYLPFVQINNVITGEHRP